MKNRHRGIIFLLLFLGLFLTGELRFSSAKKPGIPQEKDSRSVSSLSGVEDLTGVLLSGPRRDTQDTRISLMNQNKNYLKGWIYDITNKRMIDRLKEQSLSYPTTIILENQKYMQFGDDFQNLVQYFETGDIIFLKDENLDVVYTHAKTFVGDNWRVIQTANFNTTSFADNREHFFLSQNNKIREDLLRLFELDEKKISNPKNVGDRDYKLFVASLSPELVICPLNCREKLETLLKSAKKRIWISTQYIIDPEILKILQQQQNLDIRLLTNKLDTNRDLLRELGPENIRFDTKIYNHDKLTLVDDILLVGSINMSANSLDNNREIGIILTHSGFIAQAEEIFNNR